MNRHSSPLLFRSLWSIVFAATAVGCGSGDEPGDGGSSGDGDTSASSGGSGGSESEGTGGFLNGGAASGGSATGGSSAGGSSTGGGRTGGNGGTSCEDECQIPGEANCSDDAISLCVVDDDGCMVWGPARACESGSCANSSSCAGCDDECALVGDTQCTNGETQTCRADAQGCLTWGASTACGTGECGDLASCLECDNLCDFAGDLQCSNGESQECVADALGCLDWSAPVACETGVCDNSTTCGTCENTCSLSGATDCTSGAISTCVADGNGCLGWSTPIACADGYCGSATACGQCDNECSSLSETSCVDDTLMSCVADGNGCLSLNAGVACEFGACENAMVCVSCADECTLNATACTAGEISTCELATNGCTSWSAPTTCSGGCADAVSCNDCVDECDTWGVTCSAGTMQTCVNGPDGCRVLLPTACTVGCSGNECAPCDAISDPVEDVAEAELRFFREIVVENGVATVLWGQRTLAGTSTAVHGLTTYDVSDPTSVTLLDSDTLEPNASMVHLRQEAGRIFYVGNQNLEIRSAADPVGTSLGTLPLGVWPNGMSVDGDLVCLTTTAGLHFIDVSTPSAPTEIGLLPGTYAQVVCTGDYAAVLSNGDIDIIDISDPTSPTPVVTDVDPEQGIIGSGRKLAFDGTRIFVAVYDTSTLMYNVYHYTFTAPSTVTFQSKVGPIKTIGDLELVGDQVALSAMYGVGAIDFSSPTQPVITHLETTERPLGLAFDGTRIYSGATAMTVLDQSRMQEWHVEKTYEGRLQGADVQGAFSYEARDEFIINDVRDPENQVEVGRFDYAAQDVLVSGSIAYLIGRPSSSSIQLRTLSIANPWDPYPLGTVNATTGSGAMAKETFLEGNRLYVQCVYNGICVFDVSATSTPTFIGRATVTLIPDANFAIKDAHAFIPNGEQLSVYDLSDPLNPVAEGVFDLGTPSDYSGALTIEGDTLYLSVHKPGISDENILLVVDISNPSSPSVLGTVQTPYFFNSASYSSTTRAPLHSIEKRGNLLYHATPYGGIFVWDVTDPTTPVWLEEYWSFKPIDEMAFTDGSLLTYEYETVGSTAGNYNQLIHLCQ